MISTNAMIDLIEQKREAIEALCQEYGVHKLAVFGSAATGHFKGETSDVDFLVEFNTSSTHSYTDQYFGLLESLQDLLGHPVELIVRRAVRNPYFLESANRSSELLYAA